MTDSRIEITRRTHAGMGLVVGPVVETLFSDRRSKQVMATVTDTDGTVRLSVHGHHGIDPTTDTADVLELALALAKREARGILERQRREAVAP